LPGRRCFDDEIRQPSAATITGALLGFVRLAVVGLRGYQAYDGKVIAIAWAAGAITVPFVLGRLADSTLWKPQMGLYPHCTTQEPLPGFEPSARGIAAAGDASGTGAVAPSDQAGGANCDECET
jgi:hypothetical protein